MATERLQKGVGSQHIYDPRRFKEDIRPVLLQSSQYRTPFTTLAITSMNSAAPPKNNKVTQRITVGTSVYDHVSACVAGSDYNFPTMGRITIDQPLKEGKLKEILEYSPQDGLYIVATNQFVHIIMTPDESIPIKDGTSTDCYFAFPDATFTGNSTTRTATQTVIVKTDSGEAFIPFSSSTIIKGGRSVFQNQEANPNSFISNPMWECNFVEHMEAGFSIEQDMYNGLLNMDEPGTVLGQMQRENVDKFNTEMEMKLLFSQRGISFDYQGRPLRHMQGVIPGIKTNVQYYNPNNILDYEGLVMDWLHDCAFYRQPTKGNTKLFVAGRRFMKNFNKAFLSMRQLDATQGTITNTMGINVERYNFMGCQAKFVVSDMLMHELADWCICIDPSQLQLATVPGKNYNIELLTDSYDEKKLRRRDYLIEWQGTILHGLEEHHALLRT